MDEKTLHLVEDATRGRAFLNAFEPLLTATQRMAELIDPHAMRVGLAAFADSIHELPPVETLALARILSDFAARSEFIAAARSVTASSAASYEGIATPVLPAFPSLDDAAVDDADVDLGVAISSVNEALNEAAARNPSDWIRGLLDLDPPRRLKTVVRLVVVLNAVSLAVTTTANLDDHTVTACNAWISALGVLIEILWANGYPNTDDDRVRKKQRGLSSGRKPVREAAPG